MRDVREHVLIALEQKPRVSALFGHHLEDEQRLESQVPVVIDEIAENDVVVPSDLLIESLRRLRHTISGNVVGVLGESEHEDENCLAAYRSASLRRPRLSTREAASRLANRRPCVDVSRVRRNGDDHQ